MRKYLPYVIVVLAVVAGWLLLRGRGEVSGAEILSDTAQVYVYEIGGELTDYGLIEVSFAKAAEGTWYANGWIDANGDGTPSNEEWVVQNEQALVRKGYTNRFGFTRSNAEIREESAVTFALSAEKKGGFSETAESDRRVF